MTYRSLLDYLGYKDEQRLPTEMFPEFRVKIEGQRVTTWEQAQDDTRPASPVRGGRDYVRCYLGSVDGLRYYDFRARSFLGLVLVVAFYWPDNAAFGGARNPVASRTECYFLKADDDGIYHLLLRDDPQITEALEGLRVVIGLERS